MKLIWRIHCHPVRSGILLGICPVQRDTSLLSPCKGNILLNQGNPPGNGPGKDAVCLRFLPRGIACGRSFFPANKGDQKRRSCRHGQNGRAGDTAQNCPGLCFIVKEQAPGPGNILPRFCLPFFATVICKALPKAPDKLANGQADKELQAGDKEKEPEKSGTKRGQQASGCGQKKLSGKSSATQVPYRKINSLRKNKAGEGKASQPHPAPPGKRRLAGEAAD